MPEPGEIVTTTRISGIDSIIQMLGGVQAAYEQVLRGQQTMTGAFDAFKADVSSSLTNIADGVEDIQKRLAAALEDREGAINAAKAEQLAQIQADLQPLADQARALADATPDPEPSTPDEPAPPVDEPGTPAEPEPGTPQDPNA